MCYVNSAAAFICCRWSVGVVPEVRESTLGPAGGGCDEARVNTYDETKKRNGIEMEPRVVYKALLEV